MKEGSARREGRERRAWPVLVAAALGLVVVPAGLWLLLPGLPARLEAADGFYWVGAESGTGRPLLLREQADGRQIVAGSERFGIPRGEAMRCYQNQLGPLRDSARARGRIEDLTLGHGFFEHLNLAFDDLGGARANYLYRCSSRGMDPLLSWNLVPEFGVRALGIGWLLWFSVCGVALASWRRLSALRSTAAK